MILGDHDSGGHDKITMTLAFAQLVKVMPYLKVRGVNTDNVSATSFLHDMYTRENEDL